MIDFNFFKERLPVESCNGEQRCCCMDFHHVVFVENQSIALNAKKSWC